MFKRMNTRKFKSDKDFSYINISPALQDIVLSNCSENIKVIVLINKDHALERLVAVKTKLIRNGVLRKDFKSREENDVEYIKFLEKSACTLKNGKFTTIFELETPKESSLSEVLQSINDTAIIPKAGYTVTLDPLKLNPGLVTRITERVKHIGSLPFSLDNDACCVVVELNVSPKESKPFDLYEQPEKSYILIKNCEKNDYILRIDESYDKALDRIRKHVSLGEGECDYIQSNAHDFRLDLYEANLVNLMRNPFKKPRSQIFSELLALSDVIISSDDKFFSEIRSLEEGSDDDQLESFEDFFDDFAQFWQTVSHLPEDILSYKAEPIKIESNSVVKGEPLSSKEVLSRYLKYVAWEIGNKAGININLVGNIDNVDVAISNVDKNDNDLKRKYPEIDTEEHVNEDEDPVKHARNSIQEDE